jgi:heat shock protein HslJ
MVARRIAGTAALLALAVTLTACHHSASEPPYANVPFSGLGGTTWQLVEFQSMDDARGSTVPDDRRKYTITFNKDGSLSARFDCNRGVGPWRNDIANARGGSLSIGPLGVTKALCPPPSIGEFIERQLSYVRSFTVSDGYLNMALMADGGIILWEPVKPD